MGLITKGMGAVFKHIKKGKKLKTVYRVKPGVDIKQYKRSKKHSWPKKIGVEVERESGKIFSQAGSGVNIKFKKSGMPYVPKGTKPSMLTKAKGLTKIAAPAAGYTAVSASRAEKKK